MDDHNEEKRTEQNFIVRSVKSEVQVTNNRRLCWTYHVVLLKLTTDRHKILAQPQILWQQGYLYELRVAQDGKYILK